MKLLLYHFIHLYFISEFEVLFYLYYIFPYEKNMVYNLFTVDIPYNYNTTIVNEIYNDYNCKNSFDRMDTNNDKLFNYCFYYLIFINFILLLIIIYDIYLLYNKYSEVIVIQDNNDEHKTGKWIEITNRSSDEINLNVKDSNSDIPSIVDSNENLVRIETQNITKNSFIKYYLSSSKVVNEIKKLLQFILIIGAFEYLFFSYIVNKFKIANTHSILCNIIKNSL